MSATAITPPSWTRKLSSAIFGGFRKKDVRNYVNEILHEKDELAKENERLRQQLEETKRELREKKQMETSLLQSLHESQEANKRILDQAREEAKVRIARGQIKANAMLKRAEHRAKEIMQEANEKYQNQLTTMRKELQQLEHRYRLVDKHTDKLLDEMSRVLKDSTRNLSKLFNLKKISLVQQEISEANKILYKKKFSKEEDKGNSQMHVKTSPSTQEKKPSSPSNGSVQPKESNGNGNHAQATIPKEKVTASFFEEVLMSN